MLAFIINMKLAFATFLFFPNGSDFDRFENTHTNRSLYSIREKMVKY